ncbi:MAG: serine protease [Gemmataceae bacterium]
MSQATWGRWGLIVGLSLLAGAPVAADPAEDAVRATCRITRGPVSGTAFFVAVDGADGRKTLLVTAAHVLEQLKGPDAVLVLRATDRDGNPVRREVPVPLVDGKRPRWVRHAEVDVAALPVTLPDGVDVKPLPYRQIADAKGAAERRPRVGQDVYIPCYPAQLEANPAGWPVLRKGAIASYPLTPLTAARTFLVDYSHFGGESGAPVVAADGKEPMLVGVVFAMQRQTTKTTSPFEDAWSTPRSAWRWRCRHRSSATSSIDCSRSNGGAGDAASRRRLYWRGERERVGSGEESLPSGPSPVPRVSA